MIKADAMGIVIRSRHKQNAEEERASLYHAAKEAKNSKNNISSLKIGGRVIKDKLLIEKEVLEYFGALFNGHHNTDLVDTGKPFVPNEQFLGEFLVGLGRLPDAERDKLEEDFVMEELEVVIKNCDTNKSPGLDGLSYEFYKAVWPIIKDVFQEVLQCQLDRFKIIDFNTVGTRCSPSR